MAVVKHFLVCPMTSFHLAVLSRCIVNSVTPYDTKCYLLVLTVHRLANFYLLAYTNCVLDAEKT